MSWNLNQREQFGRRSRSWKRAVIFSCSTHEPGHISALSSVQETEGVSEWKRSSPSSQLVSQLPMGASARVAGRFHRRISANLISVGFCRQRRRWRDGLDSWLSAKEGIQGSCECGRDFWSDFTISMRKYWEVRAFQICLSFLTYFEVLGHMWRFQNPKYSGAHPCLLPFTHFLFKQRVFL